MRQHLWARQLVALEPRIRAGLLAEHPHHAVRDVLGPDRLIQGGARPRQGHDGREREALEHRWFLSQQAGEDVGLMPAIDDYVENVLRHAPDERAVLEPADGPDD